MKHNVFDKDEEVKGGVLSHADQEAIINLAKSTGVGSLQSAIKIYAEENESLQHGFVDAEGNDASEYFQFVSGLDFDGSNSYIFMAQNWEGAAAPAGTYTITLAKASFLEMMSWKAPAEDIVLTVKILPTGIEYVEADAEAVIYDLSGRRVTKMTRGIYIVNGKKVYVK